MKHVNFVISPGQKRFPTDLHNMKLWQCYAKNVKLFLKIQKVDERILTECPMVVLWLNNLSTIRHVF
jgi:hypothetical protein